MTKDSGPARVLPGRSRAGSRPRYVAAPPGRGPAGSRPRPVASSLGRGREREADAGADRGVGQPDPSAVRLDDRARDREPESGPRMRARGVRAAAIERGEHALALVGADAVAGV